MWFYLRKYLHFAVLAALLMVGEVCMDLVQPSLMSEIVDEGVLGASSGGVGDMGVILRVGLAMVAATVFGGACGSLNNVFANMCVQNVGNLMRKDVFARIASMSFAQVDRFGAGSLITRVTNDVTQVERYVETFMRGVIRTGFTLAGSIFFMFQLNVTFGMLALCSFPVAVLMLAVCLVKATPLFTRLQQLLDHVNSVMQEDLGGIRTIKACVREATEKGRFEAANAKLVATQLKALLVFALLNPAMNCLMYLVIALLMWIGGYQVESGATTPGVIMAAITYATQLLSSVLRLVMLSQEISRGQASWTRVKAVLGCRGELVDASAGVGAGVGEGVGAGAGEGEGAGAGVGEGAFETGSFAPGANAPSPANAPNASCAGASVEFRDVTFSFPGAEAPVLEGVSFRVEPGQTVAVMGSTGSGKSALVNLLPRFYEVCAGAVLVNDIDVRAWPLEQLRDQVAMALQRTELFGATVADNIAWGKPSATRGEIEAAARVAQAHEFIERLPNGYDTLLGPRGMSLSGGQRQRVALARAVLKDAPVMVLDDATSALDLKTEARFRQALLERRPHATTIVVAQRIASARNADAIVLLDGKRVAGVGTHEELLASNALYQEIYRSQFGSADALAGCDGARGEV